MELELKWTDRDPIKVKLQFKSTHIMAHLYKHLYTKKLLPHAWATLVHDGKTLRKEDPIRDLSKSPVYIISSPYPDSSLYKLTQLGYPLQLSITALGNSSAISPEVLAHLIAKYKAV